MRDIVNVLQEVQKTNRPIVIICDSLEGEALSSLVVNKRNGQLESCAIKIPGFGDNRLENTQDLSIILNCPVVGQDNGIPLNQVTIEHLGTCESIKIGLDETTFVGVQNDEKEIEELKQSLKDKLKTAKGYDKETIEVRLGRLQNGVAEICVGAFTESEMREKKDRVEDSLLATKSALDEGIVIGGGAALLKCKIDLSELYDEENIGAKIVLEAIQQPIKTIANNAGYTGELVASIVLESDINYGFDAISGEYVDMFEVGIIDPLKVERIGLENAISAAGTLLTVECTITIDREALVSPEMM
jgi:chaperonin GroEL